MVDTARQLLDELMGRNRNLDPSSAKCKKINWDDPEFCLYYLVKFCPHDLFVNTRADLGQCPKVHDEEAKHLYEEARPSARKRHYEDEFLRFSNHMLNEVDRKITKGKQRLLLMNKSSDGAPQPTPVYVSKFQEQLNNLNARIKKLIGEAEEAGNRGDVDQAQGLMTLCDQLKDEKDILVKQHENNPTGGAASGSGGGAGGGSFGGGGGGNNGNSAGASGSNGGNWSEFQSSEKQMEVCEVCGAFLIVGDAQQRLEDHLTGKQHMGYSRLRKAVEEMYEKRKQEQAEEDRVKDDERRHKMDNGMRDRRDDRFRRRDDFDDRRRRDDYRDRRGNDRRGDFRGSRDRDARDYRSKMDDNRDRRDRNNDRDRERYRPRHEDRDRSERRRSRSK